MGDPIITVEAWTPGLPVSFSGLGVTLRSMVPADVDDKLLERLRDPRVSSQLMLGTLNRDAFLRGLARFDNRRSFFLAITPRGNRDLLGFAFVRTDAQLVSVITLAVTDIQQWRRNVSAAAMYLLRLFLFDTVKVHKLACRVFSTNPTVSAALEDYGWVREGVLREAEAEGRDGRRDIVLFGMMRAEHLAGKMVKPYLP